MRTKAAFSVVELMITVAIFSVLMLLLVTVLSMVGRIWHRTSARDDAISQLHRARVRLVQGLLANSSQQPGQFATAKVGPNLGSGYDGDALTFLSSDDGSGKPTWSADSSTGRASPAAEISYYLVIPNLASPLPCQAGPADAAGYEQQCPFKWLVRRVDPIPSAGPTVPAGWLTWLTRPASLVETSAEQVVADQLLGFRVLSKPPDWTVQLSAVAVSEARREISVGVTPLSQSKYTVVEQFSVPAQN